MMVWTVRCIVCTFVMQVGAMQTINNVLFCGRVCIRESVRVSKPVGEGRKE